MGENVLLGATVGGVVTHHHRVDYAFRRQLPVKLAVVPGDADTANFPLLAESDEFLFNFVGKVLWLSYTEKEEYVDVIGAQLAKPLFQCAAQVRMAYEQIVRSGDHHDVLASAFQDVPQHADCLGVETIAEKEIDATIQSFVD